jgi:hypothetical protein
MKSPESLPKYSCPALSTIVGASAASLLLLAACASAQTGPGDLPYTVAEVGANFRVWQRSLSVTDALTGQVTQRIQGYTELGNGLYYRAADGAWVESQDIIEPAAGGAEAVHGLMQAHFSADVTGAGITLTTPEGEVLQSRPIGLFYADSSGKVVRIAAVQSSLGKLQTPNVIVWTNVLQGIKADLVAVWTKQGCEDSLVLREGPPPPESFGLDKGARLQYWCAMTQCPEPKEQRPVPLASGLVDHVLIFETCWLPSGSTFTLGATPVPPAGQPAQIHLVSTSEPGPIFVAKSLVTIAGQRVLIQEAYYSDSRIRRAATGGHFACPLNC